MNFNKWSKFSVKKFFGGLSPVAMVMAVAMLLAGAVFLLMLAFVVHGWPGGR